MNYNFILNEKPLPSYFKSLAFVLLVVSLISGFYIKMADSDSLFQLTSKDYRFWFLASFVILIFSKPSIEDERTAAIQLQLFRFGFRLLVALIVLMEINASLFDNDKAYGMFFHYTSAVLGLLAILSEVFLRTNLADQAEKHRGFYHIITFSLALILILFNVWIW